MVPGFSQALSVERQKDLRLAADRHRLTRAASQPTPSPRHRLGRRLHSAGERLAIRSIFGRKRAAGRPIFDHSRKRSGVLFETRQR